MAAPLLVTPEAVVLDVTTAGPPTRIVARLLDSLVQVVALFALVLVAGAASGAGAPGVVVAVLVLFAIPSILLGYPIVLETLWRGRTLGKAAMGLRVVTREGAPIRFRHAAIRGALGIVDVYALSGVVGVLAMLISKDGQRLGDLVAGTLVVRERSAARAPVAVAFSVPWGLEAYAATVDVSRMTEADHQAARAFLLRAGAMEPTARSQVAGSLAATIVTRLGRRPPDGLAPEQLLAVVVARRQQRGAPAAPTAAAGPSVSPAPSRASASGPPPVWPHPQVPLPVGRPAPVPDGGFAAPT